MDLSASIKQLETVIEARIKGLADNATADVNGAVTEVETLLGLGKSLHAANGAGADATAEPAAESPAAPTDPTPEAPADPAPEPETATEPAATSEAPQA